MTNDAIALRLIQEVVIVKYSCWLQTDQVICISIDNFSVAKDFGKVFIIFIYYMATIVRASDWLLSGQDFLVITGHYENVSRLDGSFEL